MSINANPLRAIAKDLGWAGKGGESTWGYARLLDAAEDAYWANRIIHGRRCGTVEGFADHGAGPKCQPCLRAEQWAVVHRRAAA